MKKFFNRLRQLVGTLVIITFFLFLGAMVGSYFWPDNDTHTIILRLNINQAGAVWLFRRAWYVVLAADLLLLVGFWLAAVYQKRYPNEPATTVISKTVRRWLITTPAGAKSSDQARVDDIIAKAHTAPDAKPDRFIDPTTGDFNWKYNPLPEDADIIIPGPRK